MKLSYFLSHRQHSLKKSSLLRNFLININLYPHLIICSGGGHGGPTSFAGLIPTSADVHAGRPTRRLKTFQDVAGGGGGGGTQGSAGIPYIIPLSQSDWLPPIMAPRAPNKLSSGDGSGGRTATPPAPIIWSPSAAAPMDWSVRQTLRFTSALPFDVVHSARAAPRAHGKIVDLF